MGSTISGSLPHSLEDSDSDPSNQIEGNNNTNTLIHTTPIVVNNSINNAAIQNKNQHKNEGNIHPNSNSWKCSSCGLLNTINLNQCEACFQHKSPIKNNNNKVWCWRDNNGSYIQYAQSISNELNKLNIGNTYNIKIENRKYQIKKISTNKCQQTNTKTKRKRAVIQHYSSDDAKMPLEPGSTKSAKRIQRNNKNPNQSPELSVQSQLLSMGFAQKYIRRALNVYKKNYGTNYNIEVLVEIISRLQNSDAMRNNNGNNKKKPVFDDTSIGKGSNVSSIPDDDSKVEPVHEWTNKQLKQWIHSLDIVSKENRDKIISGIEEFKINVADFWDCQNGQEIAETFDVDKTVGNVVYDKMHNVKSFQNVDEPNIENKAKLREISRKLPVKNIKKSKRKRLMTWKNKKVNLWSCDETQDYIYSLNIISEDDKNKFMNGIEQSNLTGADFLQCQNGEEIADSFDDISVQIGSLIFDELRVLSNNLMDSDVRKLFYCSLPKAKYKIVEIRKISTEKDNIYEQILIDKCKKSGRKRASIEKYLWHGSKSINNINLICKNGFDRSYNKNSAFGVGTYFAKFAKYSVMKGYCGKDKSGLSYILLCKVIVGDYMVGNSAMKQIPRKSDGKEYETLVNNVLNPTIFVVWRDYHAIPHYLIKYKCSK